MMVVAGAGCRGDSTIGLRGRVILWHSWNAQDALVLESVIEKFNDIHPDAEVIVTAIPPDLIFERFQSTAALGLGPDLIIGNDAWIHPLVDQELIVSLDQFELDLSKYPQNVFRALRYNNSIYGLPLALDTQILFYNNQRLSRTEAAAASASLEAWVAQAEEHPITITSQFAPAFWGIGAFGNEFFTEQGSVALELPAFEKWLRWLQNVQGEPGVIVSRDESVLRNLFLSGDADFYIAQASELDELQLVIEEQTLDMAIGAVTLPDGPDGPATPLLTVETIMLNSASSRRQTEVAFAVAQFLTTAEQAATFLRDTQRVPANELALMLMDSDVYPFTATVAAQTRTATAFPPSLTVDDMQPAASNAYLNVLTGVLEADIAVCNFIEAIYAASGTDLQSAQISFVCGEPQG